MKIEQVGQRTALADDTPTRDEAPNAPLSLIVGLGNPGSEYADHRHNIGFQILQALAGMHGLSFTRHKKARARVAEGQIRGRPVLLAKPQTFMNLSGRSVRRLSHEREIPPDRVLVVCDDLDLPLGRLRIRSKGGSGGQKGLRSIIDSLDSQDFARLRVGIGRPSGGVDPTEYVLQPFADEEKILLAETVHRAVEAVESWLADGIVVTMDRFNRPPTSADDGAQDEQESITDEEAEKKAAQSAPLLLPSGPQEKIT